MERTRDSVKRTRTYDVTGRRERAREQHNLVLDTARTLFLQDGYVATTVESIARAATISAATIYKSYGGKAGLVRALCQRALLGAGRVPAEQRSNSLRRGDDPREVLEAWGRLAAEVSPRISPLLQLLRAAAQSDLEAAALYEELDDARLARMADNARFLAETPHLRPGISVRDARDVLWLCSSPEMYEMLIIKRRWTRAKFSRFLTDTMVGALL